MKKEKKKEQPGGHHRICSCFRAPAKNCLPRDADVFVFDRSSDRRGKKQPQRKRERERKKYEKPNEPASRHRLKVEPRHTHTGFRITQAHLTCRAHTHTHTQTGRRRRASNCCSGGGGGQLLLPLATKCAPVLLAKSRNHPNETVEAFWLLESIGCCVVRIRNLRKLRADVNWHCCCCRPLALTTSVSRSVSPPVSPPVYEVNP